MRDYPAARLFSARNKGRRPPCIAGPPPRHGDLAATSATIWSCADLARIKCYRFNRGAPHRGPTLHGLSKPTTLRNALEAVIGYLMSGGEQ
ncbi:hypothetical protein EV660_10987 [Roseinatronobacter bogoriensis DSM 18756]|nr:hypothetical protein [Rhodobaca bogoriensis DSM 18756]TDY66861.1 hypothetical protein EV660_10987 [Rhodobaca bogoriensis DSM 18756]